MVGLETLVWAGGGDANTCWLSSQSYGIPLIYNGSTVRNVVGYSSYTIYYINSGPYVVIGVLNNYLYIIRIGAINEPPIHHKPSNTNYSKYIECSDSEKQSILDILPSAYTSYICSIAGCNLNKLSNKSIYKYKLSDLNADNVILDGKAR